MKAVLIFLFCVILNVKYSNSVETSSHEVDILWQKYGEVRSELETLKAVVKGIKANKQGDAATKSATTPEPEHQNEKPEENFHQAPSVDSEEESILDGWTAFPIRLLRVSVQHTQSAHVFSLDVAVADDSFSYVWYRDSIPVLQDDVNMSTKEISKGNSYRLMLLSHDTKENLQDTRIQLVLITTSHRQTFQFRHSDQNVTKTYKDTIIYKISTNPKSPDDRIITGNFTARWKYINPEYGIDPILFFIGLNGTSKEGYDVMKPYGFLGRYRSPLPNELFVQNSSLKNSEFQMLNWTISELLYQNGGVLKFLLNMNIEIFSNVFLYIDDLQTLRSFGYFLPDTFLSIDKVRLRTRMYKGKKNRIYCWAMGRPTPSAVILRKENNGTLVSTGFQSFVTKTKYSVFVQYVIPNVTEGFNADFVCVARSGEQEEVFPLNVTVFTSPEINYVNVTKNGDIVVVKMTMNPGDEPDPFISCNENESDGLPLYERGDVYEIEYTSFGITIIANFTGIAYRPQAFVCSISGSFGRDKTTVRLP